MNPQVEKKKGKAKIFLVCPACGHKIEATDEDGYTLEEPIVHSEAELIEVVEETAGSQGLTEEEREVLTEHYKEMLEFIDPE